MMEAAEGVQVRERGKRELEGLTPGTVELTAAAAAAGDARRGPPPLSGTSYWLDFWLFIIFDVVLFVFFYLLP